MYSQLIFIIFYFPPFFRGTRCERPWAPETHLESGAPHTSLRGAPTRGRRPATQTTGNDYNV